MSVSPVFALGDAYAQLKADSLDVLLGLYDETARFKDPFNDVTGHAPIRRIFAHMFDLLEAPRFIVLERMGDAAQGFLTWEMHYALKSRPQETHIIKGATHVRFNAQGLVTLHRDYWDAAEELYEKIPLLGILMRWLKRRMSV